MAVKGAKKILLVRYRGKNAGDELLLAAFSKTEDTGAGKLLPMPRRYNFPLLLIRLAKADEIVFLGGIFQDISSIRSYIFYKAILDIALLLRKKVRLISSCIELKSAKRLDSFIRTSKRNSERMSIRARSGRFSQLLAAAGIPHMLERDLVDLEFSALKMTEPTKMPVIVKGSDIIGTARRQLVISLNPSYYQSLYASWLDLFLARNAGKKMRFLIVDQNDLFFYRALQKRHGFRLYEYVDVTHGRTLVEFAMGKTAADVGMIIDRLHPAILLNKFGKEITVPAGGKTASYFETWQ